ncbi:hypothetical protein [Gluconobacter kondonii]|uniref:hypothetical protein n=1 Tax=Gluconobacter kondonii TaxID=941463 RepID=UPI00198200C4|nr:hypothetical protein [Gluconobacter kondonii]MBN3866475.1 hypothetical protein [Gluconobacter kondonii]
MKTIFEKKEIAMAGRRSHPRSHIYIAGSYTMLGNRFNKNGQTWKVGHAYNILDRFIFAPDSYHKRYPKDSYFPKFIWHWVEYGRSVESDIIKDLKKDIGSKNIKGIPYSNEVTFGLDIKYLVKQIRKRCNSFPTFDWDKEDYTLPFEKLKSIIDNTDMKNSRNELTRITEMVVALSGSAFSDRNFK